MGVDKLWLDLDGRPLIAGALALGAHVDRVVVACPRPRWAEVIDLLTDLAPAVETVTVAGGERRQESVFNALDATAGCEVVAVHDAARPRCTPALLAAVVAAAREHGAAIPVLPVVDSMKRVVAGRIVATVDREGLVRAQTPQAFGRDLLVDAHRRARAAGVLADDDSALVEACGATVVAVEGERGNLKVTLPEDLEALRAVAS